MPDWMADKQCRLEAIRAAKAALEAEAADSPDPKDEQRAGRLVWNALAGPGVPGRRRSSARPRAEELHRSGQPDPADPRWLRAGLQRPDRGRCQPGAAATGYRDDRQRPPVPTCEIDALDRRMGLDFCHRAST